MTPPSSAKSQIPRGSRTVGYARVSSIPQHTQLQHDALEGADCVRVFEDKTSSRVINGPGIDLVTARLTH